MGIEDPNNGLLKEFKLSSWAVGNRKTVYLVTFLIFFAGVLSYISMPKENFPELVIPEIYIGTAYPGNSPELIEDKITDPFEKEINNIKDIDKISSTTIHGFSSIQIKFNFTTTPTEGLRKVKDAVDKVMGERDFPQDLPAEPNIFEMDFSSMPVMNINLSGIDSVDLLKEYA